MRKFTILIFAILACMSVASAKSFEVELLQYSTHGNSVSVRATDDGKAVLRNVVIPQEISYDGRRYIVNEIENGGFKDCIRLESVTIPNSVTKIGSDSFSNCINLKSAIIPDDAKVELKIGFYGMTSQAGPFNGCINLVQIQGNNGKLPQYAIARLLKNCKDVPFLKNYYGEQKADYYNFAQLGNPSIAAPGFKEYAKDIVDTDIPETKNENANTFAIIIGNENYVRGVPNVDFAANDAEVFAEYCRKTLGLPENNIRKYINATYGDIISALSNIEAISKAFKGNIKVLFYYAGHGMPDESSMEAYLLPVDADGTTTEGTFSLDKLYERLGKMKSHGVMVFLDACFSGATRDDEMLAQHRSVRIKPREPKPVGNMIVMSASSGKQTALPYKAKGHGMFTYFLLDKLRKTKGNVSVGELFEHVLDNVSQQSVVINAKPQIPTLTSSSPDSDWESMKLR